MPETCVPPHNWFASLLTAFLCCGLVVSYLPQHFRIINKKSSEGFSPWFLLLGSTSSASALMNMVALQWHGIKCCRVLSLAGCFEMTSGAFMVGLQWFLFSVIFVLYIIYYPEHLKYVHPLIDVDDVGELGTLKRTHISEDWKLSIALATLTFIHCFTVFTTTFVFLLLERPVSGWAAFLGLSAATLAAIQYLPQLVHTFRLKLVGALSIASMLMQGPGSVLFIISIALQPGTNWTSWITYAVSGTLQMTLLGMCIAWKFRQSRLGIDDFGHRLVPAANGEVPRIVVVAEEQDVNEGTPLLSDR